MNKLITLIKNKPILSTIIIIILAGYLTDIPLQNYLCNFMSYPISLMISIIIVQMSSFGLCMYIVHKLDLYNTLNLNLSKHIQDLWIALPFLILIIVYFYFEIKLEFLTNTPVVFVLYCFAFLSTGFFEEILFRGIGFNLINAKLGTNVKGFYSSVFISNFISGFSHIVHLFDGTMPLINFLNQLIYATIIGIFFTSLYLRCNTLWVPILLHGLFDIPGSSSYLSITSPQVYTKSLIEAPMSCMDFISNVIIFIPFLLWGIFLLRKVNPNSNKKIKNNL